MHHVPNLLPWIKVIDDSNDDDSGDDNIEYITFLIDKKKGDNLNGHEVVAAVTPNNGCS
jgi:hypothetical protein